MTSAMVARVGQFRADSGINCKPNRHQPPLLGRDSRSDQACGQPQSTGDSSIMTSDDIDLVRASWARLQPQADRVGMGLYQRMFSDYPEVRHLFKGEMDEQAQKLTRMVGRAVGALDDLEPLDRVIKMMGARHSGYGVDERDYPKMRAALLTTLEEQLGAEFDSGTRAAWTRVYDELAGLMMEGGAS
jgi:hemoglobin-like flavoprotein